MVNLVKFLRFLHLNSILAFNKGAILQVNKSQEKVLRLCPILAMLVTAASVIYYQDGILK